MILRFAEGKGCWFRNVMEDSGKKNCVDKQAKEFLNRLFQVSEAFFEFQRKLKHFAFWYFFWFAFTIDSTEIHFKLTTNFIRPYFNTS